MATCRLCNHHELAGAAAGDDVLVKYSVRHYAHAGCALEAWGAQLFQRLTPWQCEQLPILAVARRELELELLERICEGDPAPKWAARARDEARRQRQRIQEAR